MATEFDDADAFATRGLPSHPYRLHRFTVDDYYPLGTIGVVGEGLELIDGLVCHRGTGRLVAFFPSDHDAMVARGILRPGRTTFVAGTIRDLPDG
jgi:hypothetical protein